MRKKLKERLKNELFWLLGIGVLAALLEYLFISILDAHPVMSLKVQGFIGLLIFAYIVRMITRIWKEQEDTLEK